MGAAFVKDKEKPVQWSCCFLVTSYLFRFDRQERMSCVESATLEDTVFTCFQNMETVRDAVATLNETAPHEAFQHILQVFIAREDTS